MERKSENNIYLVKGLRHEEHSISLNAMAELENIGEHGKFDSIYGFVKLTINRGNIHKNYREDCQISPANGKKRNLVSGKCN